MRKKSFWLAMVLVLLFRLPVADFLSLSGEQLQALMALSAGAFFRTNPECARVKIGLIANEAEILIIGECIKEKSDMEI